MILECSICGMQIETECELEEGQRVHCPFCKGKFSYHKPAPAPAVPSACMNSSTSINEPHRPITVRRSQRYTSGIIWAAGIMAVLAIVGLFLFLANSTASEDLSNAHAEYREQDYPKQEPPVDEITVQTEQQPEETRNQDAAEEERKNAVAGLQKYLEREGEFLNGIVAESDAAIKMIKDDQKKVSDTLAEIEAANARLEAIAKTNGWKRYGRAERVMMILKHPVMNELAAKYLGEDFSALRAECRSRVKTLLEMQRDTSLRLKANRDKYFRAQSGIDDDVEAKTEAAGKMTTSANKELETRLAELEGQRDVKTARLLQLKKRSSKAHVVGNEINALQDEIIALEKEIAHVKEVVNVSRANLSHVAATVAETTARRRGDSALSARQDDDNAVHSDMAHARSVFSLAVNYEGRSLDAVRGAMRSKVDVLFMRRQDAKQRLDYIHHASANIDMMSKEEVETLKRKIVARLGEEILNAGK